MESNPPFLGNALIIGDSLTYAGVYTDTLASIYPALKLIGSVDTPNKNKTCGYSGYSAHSFVEVQTVPFRPAGSFDMGPYFGIYGIPTIVVISVGINNLFPSVDEAAFNVNLATEIAGIDSMIAEIKAESGANTKILITAPGESSTNTSAWSFAYDPPNDDRDKWEGFRATIVSTWNSYYGGREDENIWFYPYVLNGDMDYPTTDPLHPTTAGYVKMGIQLASKLEELFY